MEKYWTRLYVFDKSWAAVDRISDVQRWFNSTNIVVKFHIIERSPTAVKFKFSFDKIEDLVWFEIACSDKLSTF